MYVRPSYIFMLIGKNKIIIILIEFIVYMYRNIYIFKKKEQNYLEERGNN